MVKKNKINGFKLAWTPAKGIRIVEVLSLATFKNKSKAKTHLQTTQISPSSYSEQIRKQLRKAGIKVMMLHTKRIEKL